MLKVNVGNTSIGTFAGTAIGTAVGESVGYQPGRSLAHVVIQTDGMVVVPVNGSGSNASMRALPRHPARPSYYANATSRRAIARGMTDWSQPARIKQLVIESLGTNTQATIDLRNR